MRVRRSTHAWSPHGRDGRESGAVAFEPGPQSEDSLHPALSPWAGHRLREAADDVLESGGRRVDGTLQLGLLPGVLDESELVDHRVEPGRSGPDGGHPAGVPEPDVDGRVHAGEDPGRRLGARQELVPRVPVLATDAGEHGGFGQARSAAHPELPVPAVAVEVLAASGRAGSHVQDRLVARVPVRFQDQHMACLVLAGETGEPGVRGVRTEAVVRVEGRDGGEARRNDEPLAREPCGDAGAAGRCEGVGGNPGVGGAPGPGPARTHEGVQGRGHRQVVAAGGRAKSGLGHERNSSG